MNYNYVQMFCRNSSSDQTRQVNLLVPTKLYWLQVNIFSNWLDFNIQFENDKVINHLTKNSLVEIDDLGTVDVETYRDVFGSEMIRFKSVYN